MTALEQGAKGKFGSIRKMAKNLGITPACIHQVNAHYRRAWPKLRQQVALALEMRENELFDENGWPREVC